MNPALHPLFARRSVRRFTDGDVDDELVRDVLMAAMAAPSAVARDPWHFFIIREQARRDAIADALPNGQMLRRAPVGILVVGDLERAHDRQLSYLLQDCSAAIENMLLAAWMLGLGSCWMGVHPREDRMAKMRTLFELPDAWVPVSVVALGWPAERPEPRTRYREDAVHGEKS